MALKVIVGLGNPGLEYENTRHNAGFMLVDRLGTASGAQFKEAAKLKCLQAKLRAWGEDILLVKPMTYMNLSGEAVIACLHFYKADAADMIVLHDDVSLPLGRLRFQKAGGAGGQHGIESIIRSLSGSKSFDRLKLGVGPDPGGARRAAYVLGRFGAADREILENILDTAQKGLEHWLSRGVEAAANNFNAISHVPVIVPPAVDDNPPLI